MLQDNTHHYCQFKKIQPRHNFLFFLAEINYSVNLYCSRVSFPQVQLLMQLSFVLFFCGAVINLIMRLSLSALFNYRCCSRFLFPFSPGKQWYLSKWHYFHKWRPESSLFSLFSFCFKGVVLYFLVLFVPFPRRGHSTICPDFFFIRMCWF